MLNKRTLLLRIPNNKNNLRQPEQLQQIETILETTWNNLKQPKTQFKSFKKSNTHQTAKENENNPKNIKLSKTTWNNLEQTK